MTMTIHDKNQKLFRGPKSLVFFASSESYEYKPQEGYDEFCVLKSSQAIGDAEMILAVLCQ